MKVIPASDIATVDRFSTTWSIIEARQSLPALIVVASASELDDTESVARGLCRAAQDAGKRTGYLYLGRNRRAPFEKERSYADLSIDGREPERERIDAWLKMWRASHDVVIVELPRLAMCVSGAHVARIADAVVVALHADRPVLAADRELTALFAQLGAAIIGVVKTVATPGAWRAEPAKGRTFGPFFPVRQR